MTAPTDAPADAPADAPTGALADGAAAQDPAAQGAAARPSAAGAGAAVPAIDLAAFETGDAAARAAVAAALDDAARRLGCFRLTGHGLDPARLSAAHATARAYFDRPEPEKRRVLATDGRGFIPRPDRAGRGSAARLSPSETFMATRFDPVPVPAAPDGFAETLAGHMAAMEDLALRLFRPIAVALGRPENAFAGDVGDSASVLKICDYLALTPGMAAGAGRCDAHRDDSAVTFIAIDRADPGGLQVEDAAARWHDVPADPAEIVVLVGRILAEWSDGAWRAPLHRVRNPRPEEGPDNRRQALIWFHSPRSTIETVRAYLRGRGAYTTYLDDQAEDGALEPLEWDSDRVDLAAIEARLRRGDAR